MYEYENTRRIVYGDGAYFIPICSICGRFVRADKEIFANDFGLKKQSNATCKKCGRIEMIFEGFFP